MQRDTIIFSILIPLAVVLLLVSCGSSEQTDSNLPKAIPVRTAPVVEKKITSTVRACGVTASSDQMKLSFKTGGVIGAIPVNEGDRVKKGTLLARLDLTEIRARVEQAEIALEKAGRDLKRVENLYRDSVATKEQFQNAGSAFENAEAMLTIARFNLAHSTITAPADGSILQILNEENELISTGQPVIIFASSEASFVLRAGISDREVVDLSLGDSAQVTFGGLDGARVTATLSQLPAGATPSGMFEIELTLDSSQGLHLLSGMIGCAEIFSSESRRLALLPIDALVDADGDSAMVYVALDGQARLRPVKLGPLQDQGIAVLKGVVPGDEVVVEGAQYLRDLKDIRIVGHNPS